MELTGGSGLCVAASCMTVVRGDVRETDSSDVPKAARAIRICGLAVCTDQHHQPVGAVGLVEVVMYPNSGRPMADRHPEYLQPASDEARMAFNVARSLVTSNYQAIMACLNVADDGWKERYEACAQSMPLFSARLQSMTQLENIEFLSRISGGCMAAPLVLAMFQLMSKLYLPFDIAVTGGFDVDGHAMSVAGVTHKLSAAVENGAKAIYIPSDNLEEALAWAQGREEGEVIVFGFKDVYGLLRSAYGDFECNKNGVDLKYSVPYQPKSSSNKRQRLS